MSNYDVVIIGGGLGGLSCGAIMSKEGFKVCILEQHSVIGGCLQSFYRSGHAFDTGMHYVGSLQEGQIMHQYFKYMGVIDSLHLQKLDEKGFDVFHFYDGTSYSHAIGYKQFVDTLSTYFPNEQAGLKRLCDKICEVGSVISPEILREGRFSRNGYDYASRSAYEEICKYIHNDRLRAVVAGNRFLYSGDRSTVSLYEFGMITHSNIEGAHAFIGGSQQLANALVDVVKSNGGEVFLGAEVSTIQLKGNKVEWLETKQGDRFYGKNIISAIHPVITFSLLRDNTVYKKAFFSRLNSLRNSYGFFTTYLQLKPQSVKCMNSNNFMFNSEDIWAMQSDYKGFNIPSTMLCMQHNFDDEYSQIVTLLTPMNLSQCEKWQNTTVGNRGAEYLEFKAKFSEAVIDFTCQFFPQLRSCIDQVYTATPLTYRDYTSTPNGSAYGLVKDYHNPMITFIPPRTRVSNLYLTGQNLNVHGCIGTVVSSAITCSEILGVEYLAKKIGNV